ncbi:50S ribosome-binding GTPase [Lacrimispora sp. NSJ-141]|uniref:50S ribosome-binding GTPase n=1 Tax=Lientehia hominis TaxID=2897778 RepID=A0AAP2RJG7_9FIRM|nr:FeoB small GTPase domain-containing protein [Lientehia hominis]MCD2492023.1 50S ribosome-binding GTPase [Lientehia hominis]
MTIDRLFRRFKKKSSSEPYTPFPGCELSCADCENTDCTGCTCCSCRPAVCRAALAGNPNVGKSTLFNALTGLHQHVGNWTGKTVACATGFCRFGKSSFELTDLPGTYSLCSDSPEEEVAREAVCQGCFHVIIAICDATSLERSLALVFQIMALTPHVILCVNLCDEAKKKGIVIDFPHLEELLGIPVVPISAAKGEGLDELLKEAGKYSDDSPEAFQSCEAPPEHFMQKAEEVSRQVTVYHRPEYRKRDFRIDRAVTGPVTGTLLMLALLFLLFWLSLSGANYPSQLLSSGFGWLEDKLYLLAGMGHVPGWIQGMLISGVYKVSTWVIAVMLPPMAIFFPLFTLLEDLGYLPRVAFNLDHQFKKCSACGKQALCM